jgi:hypothetical protein
MVQSVGGSLASEMLLPPVKNARLITKSQPSLSYVLFLKPPLSIMWRSLYHIRDLEDPPPPLSTTRCATTADTMSKSAEHTLTRCPDLLPQTFHILPDEIMDDIMRYLPQAALNSCRLCGHRVSKAATRHLFRDFRIQWRNMTYVTANSKARFGHILGRPHLADNIRAVHVISSSSIADESRHTEDLLFRLSMLRPYLDTATFEVLSEDMFRSLFGNLESLPFLNPDDESGLMWKDVETLNLRIGDWCYSEYFLSASLDGLSGISKLFRRVRSLDLGLFSHGVPTIAVDSSALQLSSTLLGGTYPCLRYLRLSDLVSHDDNLIHFLVRHKETLKSVSVKGVCLFVVEPDDALNALGQVLRFILLLQEATMLENLRLLGMMTLQSHGAKGVVLTVTECQATRSGSGDNAFPESKGLRHEIQEFICHRGNFPFPELRPYPRQIIDNEVKSEHWEKKMVHIGKGDDRLSLPVRTDETWIVE